MGVNKPLKEISRRIGELSIGDRRAVDQSSDQLPSPRGRGLLEEGADQEEKLKKKWGEGEMPLSFICQWPLLWTTTFGLMKSMAVIHNAGH